MKKLLNSFLSALVLVIIFASCESGNPLIEDAKKNIYTNNFDQSIAILDSAIAQNPQDGTAYYYKAMTYSREAATIDDPNERKPLYQNMRDAILKAKELFAAQEEETEESKTIDDLTKAAWGREHNAGIQYATDDSVMAATENPLDKSVAHLKNAVLVNPDSTLSYDVLSQVQYMNNNVQGAIDALKQSMELKNPPPTSDYDRLSAYQAQLGNHEEMVKTLEEGIEIYPDSVVLVQKLADGYMELGEREKSMQIIQDLIEEDPDNAQYRLALGTQILQATGKLSDQVAENYDRIFEIQRQLRNASDDEAEELEAEMEELTAESDEYLAEIDDLYEEAEKQLNEVLELRPDSENAYNALGVIYQNKAAALFDKRNLATDNEVANEYDAQAKESLRKAMGYYKNATEINPDKQEYWRALHRIYLTLGMNEEAEEAMEKAGM